MISSVTGLLKGQSALEVSGGNPVKLKSLQKIQAFLHLIRIVLILLGITLTVLGLTGVLGTSGLIAGGILLLGGACGLLIPLFIRGIKRYSLSKQIRSELAEVLKKLEKDALTNPELNKFLIDFKKEAQSAVKYCDVEEFSKDFYMPLLLWTIANKLPKTVKILDSDKTRIQACYLIVTQGLKHFSQLVKISKNHEDSREIFPQDRALVGNSFSDASIALTLSKKNCGMQVVRGGLVCLHTAYLPVRKSVGSEPFMTPGTPYYEMRTLYNDALAQCTEVFSLEELEKLNSIKNEKSTDENRVQNMRNGDFLIQLLTHPDNGGEFADLQLLSPNLTRGGRYDLLFG